MCGIAGYITNNKILDDRVIKIQNHRGPDDSGDYSVNLNEKNIYLIHNRLSIIDLSSAGHQPMISSDGQVILIYNGELYNFEDLKSRYLNKVSFQSKCDTEVVLQMYLAFGISFVKKLNGDFAIAILDKNRSKLFLIRDHFGVKPLYYGNNNEIFAFASEIKAILTIGFKPELNSAGLSNYFVYKYSPLQETLFKNIYRIPPAHYMEYDITSGEYNILRYWQIKKDVISKSKEDLQHQLYNLLKDATEIRLMADVPVGTFFSGGLDSSVIASFLKNKNEITHYTARKSDRDLKKEGTTSDYHFAKVLAESWKLNLVPIDINESMANPDLIRKIQYYSDDLIADGSQIPSYLITKEARRHSVVILSGMGADELFYGYKGHQLVLLANYMDHLPKYLVRYINEIMKGLNPGSGFFKAYKRHLKQFGKYFNYDKSRYGLFSIVGDYKNAISLMNNKDNTTLSTFSNYFNNDNAVFDNLFHFEMDNFLVKNLHYIDRMCMANSMEGRVPFLDYRVAEFAYSLPDKYKISAFGTTKALLKETFSEILPPQLIYRRKAGFGMPLRSILSSREKINDLLDFDFFYGLSYFSVDNINKLITNHINGVEDNSALLFALISFQYWYKIWIEETYATTHPTAKIR